MGGLPFFDVQWTQVRSLGRTCRRAPEAMPRQKQNLSGDGFACVRLASSLKTLSTCTCCSRGFTHTRLRSSHRFQRDANSDVGHLPVQKRKVKTLDRTTRPLQIVREFEPPKLEDDPQCDLTPENGPVNNSAGFSETFAQTLGKKKKPPSRRVFRHCSVIVAEFEFMNVSV